jgi:hypothetical protein
MLPSKALGAEAEHDLRSDAGSASPRRASRSQALASTFS